MAGLGLGLARPSTSFHGDGFLTESRLDVDGRNKCGHDEGVEKVRIPGVVI